MAVRRSQSLEVDVLVANGLHGQTRIVVGNNVFLVHVTPDLRRKREASGERGKGAELLGLTIAEAKEEHRGEGGRAHGSRSKERGRRGGRSELAA